MAGKRTYQLLNGIIIIGLIIVLNVLGQIFFKEWDLTEEGKYTLTQPTRDLLKKVDDVMYVKVLLEGQFPAGFKRLKNSTRDMLAEFRSIAPFIQYDFENPNDGSVSEINERRQALAKDGIIPTRLKTRDAGEAKEQQIYPFALFYYGNRMVPVNLLEPDQPGMSPEVILNNSVSLLEFKMANAIQKLKLTKKPNILFTTGHGELEPKQTEYFERELRRFYNTGRIDLDSSVQISQDVDLIVVPKPRSAFDDRHNYLLDQYIVKGGNVIFLLDMLDVALDSVGRNGNYVPPPFELNLDPILFKYGVRLLPDLVLDLQSTRIPMVVAESGGKPQTELFPWFYHPLVQSTVDHPIVSNIDAVNLQFPSSIDTIQTEADIKKTILLQSSKYTRTQLTPVRLNFEILRYEPDASKFNKPPQNLAVLLEGSFESAYKNRMSPEMLALTQQVGAPFVEKSKPGKILIVSDGDLIKNLVNPTTGEVAETGYNKFENFVFKGNQDLLTNAIEYMINDGGVLEARSKEVKLRLLDTVKAKEESGKWQLINIVVPLLLLLIFGAVFTFFRKRKYSRGL